MKDFLMFMRKAALAGAAAFAVFSCQNVKEEEPEVGKHPIKYSNGYYPEVMG